VTTMARLFDPNSRNARFGMLGWPGEYFFTPCTRWDSLLETTTEAAKGAPFGDASLLSPACSGFDQFRNYQQSSEILCRLTKSIGRGVSLSNPNMNDKKEITKK